MFNVPLASPKQFQRPPNQSSDFDLTPSQDEPQQDQQMIMKSQIILDFMKMYK